MFNVSSIRLAVIRKRIKINQSPNSATPTWMWKTEEKEELQFLDEKGNWVSIKKEILPIDDSDERAEKQSRDGNAKRTKYELSLRIERAKELRAMPDPQNTWVDISETEFFEFCEFHHAEITGMLPDGAKTYQGENGTGPIIGKTKRKEFQALADHLASWLDPFNFELKL